MKKAKPEDVAAEVQSHLTELAELFHPHCRLTFIMRNPDVPDTGHMVVSNDDIDRVAGVLLLAAKEPQQ